MMSAKGTYEHKLVEKHMEFNFSKETELTVEMHYNWQYRRVKIDLIYILEFANPGYFFPNKQPLWEWISVKNFELVEK